MNNMPVVVPSDGRAIDSENLATPDNSHNCEAPNAADVAQIKPPESPKLPLAFTVITSSNPARLTKIIGLDSNGAMRKETSAMLSRGQAQRVLVADLNGLKGHLDRQGPPVTHGRVGQRQAGERRQVGIFGRNEDGTEVDFVTVDSAGNRGLVQACVGMAAPQTRERELSALARGMEALGLREGTVVTMDDKEEVTIAGGRIRVVPAWEWLLTG